MTDLTFHLDGIDQMNMKIFPGHQIQQLAKHFLKQLQKDPKEHILIVCLRPYEDGFHDLIDSFPAVLPANLYCYSLNKDDQENYLKNVEVYQGNAEKPLVKTRMLASQSVRAVDELFRNARDPTDKTSFVYTESSSLVTDDTLLSSLPAHNLKFRAEPKTVTLKVIIDGKLATEVYVGPTHFKKTARQMLDKLIVQRLQKSPGDFVSDEVYFEYKGRKVPEQEVITPRLTEVVNLCVCKRTPMREPESTQVIMIEEYQDPVQYNSPSLSNQARGYQAQSNKSASLTQPLQKNESYTVAPAPWIGDFQAPINTQKDNSYSLNFAGPDMRTPPNQGIFKPPKESSSSSAAQNIQILPESQSKSKVQGFPQFKAELGRLLQLPDSQENDKLIKKHIATFMLNKYLE